MGIECLIVSTNRLVTPYPVYPLGAAYLSGSMEAHGHRVTHIDLLSEEGFSGLENLLSSKEFKLAAISTRNIDTVDSSDPLSLLEDTVKAVRIIRRNSSMPVVLGGPAFSIMPNELMKITGADYGVVGEGEEVLPLIAGLVEHNKKPDSRIIYGNKMKSRWYAGRYSKNAVEYYLRHGGMLNLQSKRGCPYKCSYCSYPNIEGKVVRYRDSEEVAEEFFRLVNEYGAKHIFFTDSVFNDHDGHYLKVAEALVKAGNNVSWCAFFRPTSMEKDEFKLLKKAGLSAMELGTDASTDITISALNKGFEFSDVVNFNENAVALGIPCAHFVIFGGPGETPDTLRQGLKNIEGLKDSVIFAFTGIRLLPGTALYETALHEGLINDDSSLVEPFFYFSREIERDLLDKSIRKAWHGRMERVYPCSDMEARVSMLHEMGHVGPMWDALIRHRLKRVTG